MNPLGQLSADPDSENDKCQYPHNKSAFEPASPYAKNVIKYLQSMHQKLYFDKDTNACADGW